MATNTFSRLVPVSRDPRHCLDIQFRHQTLPGYLPAPNHNGDTSNDRQLTELADEMAAVRFNYSFCLGAQELSGADREMFRLVAKLATEAAPSACQDLSEVIQKVNVVRTMDRYIRENNSERSAILDELTSRTNDRGIFRVHAHLGDYAGALCSLLKEKKTSTLSRSWTSIVPALDRCDERVASWKASGSSGAEPSCPEKDEIAARVHELINLSGRTELDIDLALFAIRSYARRNFVCHGEIFELYQSGNQAGLAQYLDDDVKLLEDFLPGEEKPMADNWRRLISFYRQRHLDQEPNCQGDRQLALGDAVLESPLSKRASGFYGQAFLRTQIELGQCREEHSRDGPPAQNVWFDPNKIRRRSEPCSRGRITKRSASRSPKRSSVRARNRLYTSKLETVSKTFSSEAAESLAKLQLELHSLAMKLANIAPQKAIIELEPVRLKLKQRLESARAAVLKETHKAEKAERKLLGRGPAGPAEGDVDGIGSFFD